MHLCIVDSVSYTVSHILNILLYIVIRPRMHGLMSHGRDSPEDPRTDSGDQSEARRPGEPLVSVPINPV